MYQLGLRFSINYLSYQKSKIKSNRRYIKELSKIFSSLDAGKQYRLTAYFGVVSFVLTLLTCYLLLKQNHLIENQNILIDSQRKGDLVLLLSDLMNQVSIEVSLKNGKLSGETKSRIVALSHSFKPYKSLSFSNDLGSKLSPERGQLLTFLALSNVNKSDLSYVFSQGNFKYSDLEGVKIRDGYLKRVDLSGANLTNAKLLNSNIDSAYFLNTTLENVSFVGSDLSYSQFESDIDSCSFYNTLLYDVDFNSSSLNACNFEDVTFFNSKFINATLENVNFGSSNIDEVIVGSDRSIKKLDPFGRMTTDVHCDCDKNLVETDFNEKYHVNIKSFYLASDFIISNQKIDELFNVSEDKLENGDTYDYYCRREYHQCCFSKIFQNLLYD